MKKLKQLLRDVRIALGKLILDSNKAVLDTAELQPIKSILFLRQDGKIGDYIVSSFVFRELKKQNPNIKIGVVCSDKSLFEKNPNIDILYPVRKKNILDYVKTGIQLRKEHYDVLIDPTVFLRNRDLLLIRLINAEVNIGYLKADYQMFNLSIDNQQLHFSKVYINALNLLGIAQVDSRYDIVRDDESERKIAEFIKYNNLQQIIALNCFGAARARRFSDNNIRRLLDRLTSLCPQKSIILLAYPQVTQQLAEIAKQYVNVIVYENTQSIFDSIAIIRAAETVISPDTAIVHIASGLEKNLIAFYQDKTLAPINFAHWQPNNSAQTHILFYQNHINEIVAEDIQADWVNV